MLCNRLCWTVYIHIISVTFSSHRIWKVSFDHTIVIIKDLRLNVKKDIEALQPLGSNLILVDFIKTLMIFKRCHNQSFFNFKFSKSPEWFKFQEIKLQKNCVAFLCNFRYYAICKPMVAPSKMYCIQGKKNNIYFMDNIISFGCTRRIRKG